MYDQVIICPHCGREIPLTEAISHKIREQLEKDFAAERKEKEQMLKEKIDALILKEKTLEEQIILRVNREKKKLEEEAFRRAEEATSLVMKDLHKQLADKEKRLNDAWANELKLRQERRELEEKQQALELEITRRLDEERDKIRETAVTGVREEYLLKDREKDKMITDMKQQIEILKQKAERGSQQTQGEVLELVLEDFLRMQFPHDQIEPVPKGIKGADIIQTVHNPEGQNCGTIVWESKRTRTWNDAWIDKLKDDQRQIKADSAILLSDILPRDVKNFAYRGVWITNYDSMQGLATALRMHLIQTTMAKRAVIGKNEKMEILYQYLSGSEFRQRIEAIVEAFIAMKRDLDQEKRAMTKIWSKREKQIERVVTSTAGMYGDMQGLIGASLPEIKSLEIETVNGSDDIV